MALFTVKKKTPTVDPAIAERIKRRRLQLLVHSCIYYELNQNLISDSTFDKWSVELLELQKKYPKVAEQVCWHQAFKDWDASTGAYLPIRDTWVMSKALELLKIGGVKF